MYKAWAKNELTMVRNPNQAKKYSQFSDSLKMPNILSVLSTLFNQEIPAAIPIIKIARL